MRYTDGWGGWLTGRRQRQTDTRWCCDREIILIHTFKVRQNFTLSFPTTRNTVTSYWSLFSERLTVQHKQQHKPELKDKSPGHTFILPTHYISAPYMWRMRQMVPSLGNQNSKKVSDKWPQEKKKKQKTTQYFTTYDSEDLTDLQSIIYNIP